MWHHRVSNPIIPEHRASGVAREGRLSLIQNEVALVVAADKRGYLLEDVDVFNWTLTDADFHLLSTAPLAPEGPTRGNCVSPTNPKSQITM